MLPYYGLLGITLIFISYTLRVFGYPFVTESFVLGYWFFFDALDFRLSGNSILHRIRKRKAILFYAVIAGMTIGIFVDFFGSYLGGLWSYKGFFWAGYAKGVLFGYGVMMLSYYSVYRVIKHVMTKELGMFGEKFLKPSQERWIFHIVLYAGILLALAPLTLNNYNTEPFSRTLIFGMSLLGAWLTLEGVEYAERRRSLLKDVFEGRWTAPSALVIAALLTGIFWEAFNVIDLAWTYTNIPLAGTNVLGVPIVVVLGWVPLFVLYLSFYSAIFRERVF